MALFRIRRVYDDIVPVNREALREVQALLRQQFPGVPAHEVDLIGEKLRHGTPSGFRTILDVAEGSPRRVLGFALVSHDPVLKFCLLDFLASVPGASGRGIGAALYEHVRDECLALGVNGLFYECLPDEPDRCKDPKVCQQNAKRLRFYERWGARPIINTAYETPLRPNETDNLPFLVWDGLDHLTSLRREFTKKAVRAILQRKYGDICPPGYIDNVVASIRDDPVKIRSPRYVKSEPAEKATPLLPERIVMTVNDRHDIHHIRERGYVESPVRIRAILNALEPSGLMETVEVQEHTFELIKEVHDPDFVDYLERACAETPERKSVYPYVFPIRNVTRPPKDLGLRAGYYCIDTFTPINRNAFPAAKRAVDCTLTAASYILQGRHLAYSLVRPPGHHAEHRVFGGFCYFNNAAIAAEYFSRLGKVALLDIDYHHGNGQQDIFWERADVLTISIHGDPDFAYPYFSGFVDERGGAEGEGFNINYPLPEQQDGPTYRQTLTQALAEIEKFDPSYLVVALGLDPARGDPTGTWSLTPKDFEANGKMIGRLGLPTLVVQEGGYRTRTLGVNARAFFRGLSQGAFL
jgi:acetoin utilization deacetylase AcuC-like enzyme/GNAT superfamily N-acetyltransferase